MGCKACVVPSARQNHVIQLPLPTVAVYCDELKSRSPFVTSIHCPCVNPERTTPWNRYAQPPLRRVFATGQRFLAVDLGRYLPAMPDRQQVVLDASRMDRAIRRMADEIVELNEGTDDLIIVGIQRRGVQLAARIVSSIRDREGADVPNGALDITLYRDDLQTVGPRPVVGPTNLPWAIDGKHVVIVDDVLYTGRTIRAALDELADFGRPRRIGLAVLIDRGGRELPIQPDVVGKAVEVKPTQRVDVLVKELDDRDAVIIAEKT